MQTQLGLWAFFMGMLLALATAFVPLGNWAEQVLIVLGLLAGGFHKKLRDELLTLGVIYVALSLAVDSVRDLIGLGPIITSIVAAWVRFLGPVVLSAFMVWGGSFLMVNRAGKA